MICFVGYQKNTSLLKLSANFFFSDDKPPAHNMFQYDVTLFPRLEEILPSVGDSAGCAHFCDGTKAEIDVIILCIGFIYEFKYVVKVLCFT